MKFTLTIAALVAFTSATKLETKDYFQPWEHVVGGKEEGKYERVTPKHFSADNDDLFMRSMI